MDQHDVQMKIRVDKEAHDWLRQYACCRERSLNWVVNKLIEQAKRAQEAGHELPA